VEFRFVGASALVLDTHRPQGATRFRPSNDFLVRYMALARLPLDSCWRYGWSAVNIVVFPPVLLGFAVLTLASFRERRRRLQVIDEFPEPSIWEVLMPSRTLLDEFIAVVEAATMRAHRALLHRRRQQCRKTQHLRGSAATDWSRMSAAYCADIRRYSKPMSSVLEAIGLRSTGYSNSPVARAKCTASMRSPRRSGAATRSSASGSFTTPAAEILIRALSHISGGVEASARCSVPACAVYEMNLGMNAPESPPAIDETSIRSMAGGSSRSAFLVATFGGLWLLRPECLSRRICIRIHGWPTSLISTGDDVFLSVRRAAGRVRSEASGRSAANCMLAGAVW